MNVCIYSRLSVWRCVHQVLWFIKLTCTLMYMDTDERRNQWVDTPLRRQMPDQLGRTCYTTSSCLVKEYRFSTAAITNLDRKKYNIVFLHLIDALSKQPRFFL